ncbi:MAG TPA: hypothetical protein VD766_13805 [Solirubrobacterales bacterium]|nr:hypothetical protein [Solirubrobacterales bacterium]
MAATRADAVEVEPGVSVDFPPSGSQIGIQGPFGQNGYFESEFPFAISCPGSFTVTIGVDNGSGPGAFLTGGLLTEFNINDPYNGLTIRGTQDGLPHTDHVVISGWCWVPGSPPRQVYFNFQTAVTYVEGVATPAPGAGGDTTPGGGTGTSPTTGSSPEKKSKPKKRKRKGILDEKGKRALDRASDNLVGYAENAGSLGGLCAFSNIKKEAIEESVKLVAKDLAQSQVPLLNQIPTDACSFTMSAFTGWLYIEAYAFDEIAKDPPQPRYRRAVRARVRVPVTVRATGIQRPLASSLNAALVTVARSRANLDALLDANERLQGAQRRHDRRWTRRHKAAAKSFALRASRELKRLPSRFATLAQALRKAGYIDRAPAAHEVGPLQNRFANGLPADMRATLAVLGVAKSDLKQLAGALAAAAPDGAGFPGVLESPATAKVFKDAANELRRIAR